MKFILTMKDGGWFNVTADRVSLDGGAARFTNTNRLGDNLVAMVCAGSWARVEAEGAGLEWTPAPCGHGNT
jgi:hypothetical protein